MKPLKANSKRPRGSAVNVERDRTKDYTLKLSREIDARLAIIAEEFFQIDEPDLAATARKLRREMGDLERRISNMHVVKPKSD